MSVQKIVAAAVAALLMVGVVGVAKESKSKPVAAPSTPDDRETVALRAKIADLEQRLTAARAERKKLDDEKAAAAAPSADATPKAESKAIDWAALDASFNWKRLAELNAKSPRDEAGEAELKELRERSTQLTIEVAAAIDPVALGGQGRVLRRGWETEDSHLIWGLCLLKAWSVEHPALLPAVEAARAQIDVLIVDHDALLMANVLKTIDIRNGVVGRCAELSLADANARIFQADYANRPVTLLDASSGDEAVDVLTRHWIEDLELGDGDRPTVKAIVRPYVDAWLKIPCHEEQLKRNEGIYGSSASNRSELEAFVAMQRNLLNAFPLGDAAREWLLRRDAMFTFCRQEKK